MKTKAEPEMEIRELKTLEEFQRCVELQKSVWGLEDPFDAVPLPLLVVSQKHGGCILGAFQDEALVGFVYSFVGRHGTGLLHHSHMLAVLPEHRNAQVGYRLKRAQRDFVLHQGIDLITWTYDPLLSLNAHFNLTKLGAVADEYEPNVYGVSSSPLHRGLDTDRFLVKWHLESRRVCDRLAGKGPPSLVDLMELAARINRIQGKDKILRSTEPDLDLVAETVALEIPSDFPAVKEQSLEVAQDWQRKTRKAFLHYLGRGYAATEFYRNPDLEKKTALYLLQRK
ncbi:MAG: GNAT family N-acetyltransferase [Acidobacteria bacterium]|nr:GNAT family N-acetyltransferase [Acidobacteriota bacterium]